ncbi:MAG: diguanylate cyclase [Planctomycetota bacterium]|nr:MAG: diguanylate cyclase [Planctomycetota bacterium]
MRTIVHRGGHAMDRDRMHVLVVDDDPVTVRLISRALLNVGADVTAADNAEVALDFVCNGAYDVVVTDWVLPGMSGVDLCREIRSRAGELGRYVYLMLMTARAGKHGLVEAFEAGADDFISKPVDGEEIRVRLLAARRVLSLERRLRFLAEHDPLTSLLNRRTFLQRSETEWERARRYGRALSCVMIDLDRFKAINDCYGHFGGDAVLVNVAGLIRQLCRSSELSGRFGGEEFCVLLPETDRRGALAAAERIRRAIAATPAFFEGQEIRVTASLGVAEASAEMPDLKALINAADRALLDAKRNGRNQVRCFTPPGHAQLPELRANEGQQARHRKAVPAADEAAGVGDAAAVPVAAQPPELSPEVGGMLAPAARPQ